MTIIVRMLLAVAITVVVVWLLHVRWRRQFKARNDEDPTGSALDRAKLWLEVLALSVAGPLAVVTFLSLERWTLHPQAEISSDLRSRYQRSSGQCLTEFVVTVKNPARTRLKVNRVETALVVVPPVRSNDIQRVHFDTVGTGALRPDKGLTFKYPPGVQYTDAFLWTHPPRPDTLLLARVQLYAGNDTVDYHYNWTDACSPSDTLRTRADQAGGG